MTEYRDLRFLYSKRKTYSITIKFNQSDKMEPLERDSTQATKTIQLAKETQATFLEESVFNFLDFKGAQARTPIGVELIRGMISGTTHVFPVVPEDSS
jgi:hypothetical protein